MVLTSLSMLLIAYRESSQMSTLRRHETNFRTLVVNCNCAKGKQAELAEQCRCTTDADALIICETKIYYSVNVSYFLPTNYVCATRKDRSLHGGGVMIAVKCNLVVEEVELVDISCEVTWARITLTYNSPRFIGAYYRPPSDGVDSLEELDKSLSQLMQMTKNNSRATVVLGGDFNACEINWDTCTVSETTKRLVREKTLDIFGNYSITQLQRDPTREGAFIDLIGTNKPNLVKRVNTIPGIYDHDIIVLDADLKAERTKKTPHKVYQWDNANWEQMKQRTKVFATKYLTEAHSRNTKTNYQAMSLANLPGREQTYRG